MEELKEALFIRISHPWEKVKELVMNWEAYCLTIVVYQHDADEDVNRTHCHMVLTGLCVGRKRLRQIADSKGFPIKGNENCSIVAYDGSKTPYVYMAKGTLDPVFLKGFDQNTAEEWKQAWVEPNQRESKLPKIEEMYNLFKHNAHKTTPNWQMLKNNAWNHVGAFRKVRDNQFFQYYKAIVLTYVDDYQDLLDFKVPRSDPWFAKGLPDCMLEKAVPTNIITHPSGILMEL